MYCQNEAALLMIIYLQFVVCHLNFKDIEASNRDYIDILMNITEAFQCLNVQFYQDIHEELYRNMFKHLFIPVIIGDLRFHSSCKQQLLVVDENGCNVETFSIDILLILLVLDSDCSRMGKITQAYRGNRKILIVCVYKNIVHLIKNSELTNNVSDLSNLFAESTKRLPNYSGKSLSVFTFNCPLFSYGTIGDIDNSSNRTGELDGIEMKMFLEVAKQLNFSWKLREPPELNKWGSRLNGTWSGGIKGPLANGTADVGFCGLWLIVPQSEDFELTVPWDILCNTFVVPRPRQMNSVGAVFTPFEWPVWCVLIIVTLLITFILEYLQGISFRIHFVSTHEGDLVKHFLDLLGILTLASFPPSRSGFQERRHIWAWWTVFALLITTAYSSGLVSHLTIPQFEPLLDSIRDLVLRNIKWSGFEAFTATSILRPQNRWHSLFLKNYYIDERTAENGYHFHVKDHAAYGFTIDGGIPFFLQGGLPMNSSAYPFLRVMKECASRYYISLGLAKNSPYTLAFNKVISRLIESGVVKHWKETVANNHADSEMAKLFVDTETLSTEPQPLKLMNILGGFVLLSCGLTIGFAVFVLENCSMAKWRS